MGSRLQRNEYRVYSCFNLLSTCCRTYNSSQDGVFLHFTDEETGCDKIMFKVQWGHLSVSHCCIKKKNHPKIQWLKTISIYYCFQVSASAICFLWPWPGSLMYLQSPVGWVILLTLTWGRLAIRLVQDGLMGSLALFHLSPVHVTHIPPVGQLCSLGTGKQQGGKPSFKLLFASCLSTSHWPKQPTWPSPASEWMELKVYRAKGMEMGDHEQGLKESI